VGVWTLLFLPLPCLGTQNQALERGRSVGLPTSRRHVRGRKRTRGLAGAAAGEARGGVVAFLFRVAVG
jgi:hypothetical protein